jgi:hypothetical protein
MVEAELQAITYNEFLPLLLGTNKGGMPAYKGYNPAVDSSVSNEFSAAAYRFGHDLVSPILARLTESGKTVEYGDIPLKDAFFISCRLCNEGGIEPLLRGFAATFSEQLDGRVIDALRNMLFNPIHGLDLASINLQRGRDHGLPTINQFRQNVGLPVYTTFEELTGDPARAAEMSSAYGGDISLVDLWIGGLVERKFNDGQLGETFNYIIKDQFIRLRDGDRFWYERRLTKDMVALVNDTKLSDIIIRNTGIEQIQENVFLQADRCGCPY